MPFSGVAGGDEYTLTVGSAVTDECGSPVAQPAEVTLRINSGESVAWSSCATGSTLTLGVSASPPVLPTGDWDNDGHGSCEIVYGADLVASYTAASTDSLQFSWSNVQLVSGTDRSYELWRESCDPLVGTELLCELTDQEAYTHTVHGVQPGDVYFMKVVAKGDHDDFASATFRVDTVACVDPVAGPPAVTSNDAAYPSGTTSDNYFLVFNEDVFGVTPNLTWAPVVGSGVMGTPYAVDPFRYRIPFAGVVDGDEYTLTVGSGVADTCGNTLSAPVDITIQLSNDAIPTWANCTEFGVLELDVPASPPNLPTGDFSGGGSGSCASANGAHLVAQYTATTTDPLRFTWSNVSMVSGGWINYELWLNQCPQGPTGEIHCYDSQNSTYTHTVSSVQIGDVFYMKAIADPTSNDFVSATFLVEHAN